MAKKNNVCIYLDNNASTTLSEDVSGVVMDVLINDIYSNPSSVHDMGSKVKKIVNASRVGVATSLDCGASEIIFTSGGTEANNLAVRGIYDKEIPGPKEIVISAGEHSSVYNTAMAVAGEDNVRLIPLLPSGELDLEWADRLITEDTALVSVMLVNNETGVIFPVKKIVDIAHSKGVLVHCDAVQAYGKMNLSVKDLGVDLLSISGHKIHALPGIGALFVRKGVLIHSMISGGSQEFGLRSGTENYVGIASLGTASNEISSAPENNISGLRDVFEVGILKRISDVVINGKSAERVSNTSSITFKGVHSASLVAALSAQGVYASAGSACSSGMVRPSRVLLSMGLSEEEALSTVRFSFSRFTTLTDVAVAINCCVESVKNLRGR